MRYGDVTIRYESTDPRVRFAVSHGYEEFRVSLEERATCEVDWTFGAVQIASGKPDVSTSIWEVRRLASGAEQTVFFLGDARKPYLSLTFDPSFGRATIIQAHADRAQTVAHPELYPIAEYMASRLLGRVGAVELHASAAVVNGRAFVFMGHSGAGKTTIARIAEAAGATILSDDRTILGFREDSPTAWGTPWHGSGRKSSARVAPLHGIYLLAQSSRDRLEPLPTARAVQEMFVRLVHFRVTVAESLAAHETLERLAARASMYILHFLPTPAAVALVTNGTD